MNLLPNLLSPEDRVYFSEFTRAVTDACKLSNAAQAVKDKYPCNLAFDPIKPGGVNAYPAVWTQDFTMIFSAGFVEADVGLAHLRLILGVQNSEAERQMNTGALVPMWAIADHVNFNGTPVFFPGTYSSGPDQGGRWGLRPPYNNYFDVIWLARLLTDRLADPIAMLNENIGGLTVYERLVKAFGVPPTDSQGIVYTLAESRAIGFIFYDSVQMTGSLLMATLLRTRAAGHLRDLAMLLGRDSDADAYAAEARRALPFIADVFAHESGWLRASTSLSGQPDVFGTLYALFTGSLQGAARETSVQTVLKSLDDGLIEQDGALRHVPLNHNFSEESTWEVCHIENNTYQNGGFWYMPAGWLTAVLYEYRPEAARAYLQRYLNSMKKEDFRKGQSFAPWEWIFNEKRSDVCPVFGPSATLPFAVLSGLV